MYTRLLSLQRSQHVCNTVALAAAASMPFAFQVREQQHAADSDEPTIVSAPIADNQHVEKRWTLENAHHRSSSSDNNNATSPRRITAIKISVPGLTFVSVDPCFDASSSSDTTDAPAPQLAYVRASSDHAALLAQLEVVPLDGHPTGVEIRVRQDVLCTNDAPTSGHVLTELVLAHPAGVTSVDVRGGSVVVLQDNVVASTDTATAADAADVTLSLTGHGALFVDAPATALHVQRLELSVTGSGHIQVDAASIAARDDVLLRVAGVGHAHLVARETLRAATLRSSISGAGATLTAVGATTTKNMKDNTDNTDNKDDSDSEALHVHKLKVSIAGVGRAVHCGAGRAAIQRVTIAGAGSVATPGVQSESATMRVVGACDATLDVRGAFESYCRGGESVVRFVHALPVTHKRLGGLSSMLSVERARRRASIWDAGARASDSQRLLVPTRRDAFDDVVVVLHDPLTTAPAAAADGTSRDEPFDVFRAISALKRALRSDRSSSSQQQQQQQ